jgi:hypothetical protein
MKKAYIGLDTESGEFIFVMSGGKELRAFVCKLIKAWVVHYTVFGFNIEHLKLMRAPEGEAETALAGRALAKFHARYPDYEVCPVSLMV